MLLALPALLAFSACGDKKDEPVPAQSRVKFVHASYVNSLRPLKASVGAQTGPTIAYGADTPYQTVAAGSQVVKVDIASTGGSNVYSAPQTLGQDKAYTFFAYDAAGQPAGTVAGLLAEDNLTAPAAGKAKVRLVHVGFGLDSPLSLARVPQGGGALAAVTTPVAAGAASAFVDIDAGTGSYNLANSNNASIQPAFGASVLGTPFVAGGIYSIVIRGTTNTIAPTDTEKFTLQLIKHN